MPLLILTLLAACTPSDEGDDSGAADASLSATIAIASPADGATFENGEAVPLSVTATKGRHDVAVSDATWTIGDWTGNGASTEATGLAAGTHTVGVEAVVEGETLTASVSIEVLPPEDPPEPVSYAGTLTASVVVDSSEWGTFEDGCNDGTVTFVVNPQGAIAGQGLCEMFDETWTFQLEGNASGGAHSGDMILTYEGEEARTPWNGTGDVGGPLRADFDTTHSAGRDSLRIYGSWSATPVR